MTREGQGVIIKAFSPSPGCLLIGTNIRGSRVLTAKSGKAWNCLLPPLRAGNSDSLCPVQTVFVPTVLGTEKPKQGCFSPRVQIPVRGMSFLSTTMGTEGRERPCTHPRTLSRKSHPAGTMGSNMIRCRLHDCLAPFSYYYTVTDEWRGRVCREQWRAHGGHESEVRSGTEPERCLLTRG